MMPTVELKAPPGQFRVVAVDTFDGTDWVHGDFATAEEALRAARSKGGEMLKTHVYDDAGKHLGDAGRF
jgi:ethanolamine utilization microcompartment shell protein EutS